MMTRYLGIDYGAKRIGLAVGDSDTRTASPLRTIGPGRDQSQFIRELLKIAEEYDVDAYVIGLPLNMDGTEGTQARLTRGFAAVLSAQSEKIVYLADERLSSRAADELLHSAGLTRGKKRERHDAVAAQVILQSFLDARPGKEHGS